MFESNPGKACVLDNKSFYFTQRLRQIILLTYRFIYNITIRTGKNEMICVTVLPMAIELVVPVDLSCVMGTLVVMTQQFLSPKAASLSDTSVSC